MDIRAFVQANGSAIHGFSTAAALTSATWMGMTVRADWQNGSYKTMAAKAALVATTTFAALASSKVSSLNIANRAGSALNFVGRHLVHYTNVAANAAAKVCDRAATWAEEMMKAKKPAA